MDEELLLVMAGMIVTVAFLCCLVFLLTPSQMKVCIDAKYEWRGGDCVMGVDHD